MNISPGTCIFCGQSTTTITPNVAPTALIESRRAAVLARLNSSISAAQFSCPNEILRYGYNLLTPGPKEEEVFLAALRTARLFPEVLHEMIRSYVYAYPTFTYNTFAEWFDYLDLDEKTKKDLIETLNHINQQSKIFTHAKVIQCVLEKVYIRIRHIVYSLNGKSPDKRVRFEKVLKNKMEDLIKIIIKDADRCIDPAVKILCEIETESGNREPFLEHLASLILLGNFMTLAYETQPNPPNQTPQELNGVFEALGIETSPDFLPNLTCPFPVSIEGCLERYKPVEALQMPSRSPDGGVLHKALLEWAIKYYNLDQFEIVDGKREYDPLTRALCQNPEELEANEGIKGDGIQLTEEAILFLLEATGIIRKIPDAK